MTYEEKWNELLDFIEDYKEAVELMNISMISESDSFKRGELSSLRAIKYKMNKLNTNTKDVTE